MFRNFNVCIFNKEASLFVDVMLSWRSYSRQINMALKLGKCRLCLKLGDFYSIFTMDNALQLSDMAMDCARIKVRIVNFGEYISFDGTCGSRVDDSYHVTIDTLTGWFAVCWCFYGTFTIIRQRQLIISCSNYKTQKF